MHVSTKPWPMPRIALLNPGAAPVPQGRPGLAIQPLAGDQGRGDRRPGRNPPGQRWERPSDADGPGTGSRAGFAALLAKHDLDGLG